jgi:ABC-2 type transport system permease protein
LVFGSGRTDAGVSTALTTTLTLAFLFPVYYNLLSMVVTRRDDLVLKRLRTGESTGAEIIAGTALPGAVVAFTVVLLTVPMGLAVGLGLPVNPVLYFLGAVVGIVTFVGFALWTAAWTTNAEAAQLTSLPIFFVAMIGMFAEALPDGFSEVAHWTPGAAVKSVVDLAWIGVDGAGRVGFVDAWALALEPLAILVAWAVLGCALAVRSMRWEPRT